MSDQTQAKKAKAPLNWHVVGRFSRKRYSSFRTRWEAQREAEKMIRQEHVPAGTYEVIEMDLQNSKGGK